MSSFTGHLRDKNNFCLRWIEAEGWNVDGKAKGGIETSGIIAMNLRKLFPAAKVKEKNNIYDLN